MSLYGLPKDALHRAANQILTCRWIPKEHRPTPKQMLAMLSPHREVFFGGAAGGGKSNLLLAGALQFADVPGFSAIIFRRTYTDLALPGALMDRARQWLQGTAAHWSGTDKKWTFPSGASLQFAYMDKAGDEERYQSAEFQYIGWDELSHWPTDTEYTYLFSRLRRTTASGWVPLRCRSASNPGGPGHDWLKKRFLDDRHAERLFIPSRIQDNPHLDQAEYDKSLAYLDDYRRAQLKDGNWEVRPPGELFDSQDFRVLAADQMPTPQQLGRPVRFWDLAGADPDANPRADWTVGAKMVRDAWGRFLILDVIRFRAKPAKVRARILATARAENYAVRVRIGLDPGQAGLDQEESYTALLRGFDFEARRESGSKYIRAMPMAAAVGSGLVYLVAGDWHGAFFSEYEAFNDDPKSYAHDDQVDAGANAFNILAGESIPGVMPSLTDADLSDVLRGGKTTDRVKQALYSRGWDLNRGIRL